MSASAGLLELGLQALGLVVLGVDFQSTCELGDGAGRHPLLEVCASERQSRGDSFIPVAWSLLAAAMAIQGLTESRPLVEGGWYMVVALFCLGPQLFTLTVVDEELVHYGSRSDPPPGHSEP